MGKPTKHQFEHLKAVFKQFKQLSEQLNNSPVQQHATIGKMVAAEMGSLVQIYENLDNLSFQQFESSPITAEIVNYNILQLEFTKNMMIGLLNQNLEMMMINKQNIRGLGAKEQKFSNSPLFSLAVGSALDFLIRQKLCITSQQFKMDDNKRKKYLDYIEADFKQLQEMPQATDDEIIVKLRKGKSDQELAHFDYYQELILVLENILSSIPKPKAKASATAITIATPLKQQVNVSKPTISSAPPLPIVSREPTQHPIEIVNISATSSSNPSPIAPPSKQPTVANPQGFFPATPESQANPSLTQRDKKTIITCKLDSYIHLRKSEWEYHYNFLNMVAFIYYLSDFLLGTDYLHTKNREIKLSAATKYKQIVNGDSTIPLTPAEKEALRDSRLGKIVKEAEEFDILIKTSSFTVPEDAYYFNYLC